MVRGKWGAWGEIFGGFYTPWSVTLLYFPFIIILLLFFEWWFWNTIMMDLGLWGRSLQA
jgi:hypothetical protein